MKRLVAIFSLLLIAGMSSVQAQCTPLASATSLLTPAPVVPLPAGTVGTPYAQVITVTVPQDTNIDVSALIGFPFPAVTVTVNTLTLGAATGLPAGLTATNNPVSGIINGGAQGCIDLSGTPTTSGQNVVGFPMTLNITVPQSVPVIGGTTQNIPATTPYNLEITGATAVTPQGATGLVVEQNLPNPATGLTVVRYSVTAISDVQLTVVDLKGQRVLAMTQRGVAGAQSFRVDVSDLAPGLYLYSVSDGKHQVVRKLVVN